MEPANLSISGIRKRFTVLIFFLLVFICGKISAQPANYSFTASDGTFTPISGTAVTLTGSLSEGYYNNIPIGFTFRYWNNNYTTVSASTNGWLTFGQAITNAQPINNLITGGTRPLAAPLWDDLSMSAAGDFSYQTTGTAGQRVFTAQWLNIKWNLVAPAGISFQVKLYEADGKLEFIYNQLAGILRTPSASIGLAGPQTGNYNFVSLSSPYYDAVASSSAETSTISDKPVTGQVFSFVPVTITESSPSQIPAGNIGIGNTDMLLSSFQITASGADAVLKTLQFNTTGTATGADISNLKLFHSASPVFPGGTPVATIATYNGTGAYTFTGMNQLVSGTGYFWITGDVNAGAIIGHNISISANPGMTFAAGTPTGTISQGGVRTISGSVVVISSPNPSVPTGGVIQNTIDNVIYRLDISVSDASETITGLQITTAGTYTENDAPVIIAYYSDDDIFSVPDDTPLSLITSGTGPGLHIFPYWTNYTIQANTTGHIFITSDIPCAATAGATISVNAVTSADVTFLSGTKSGSAYAGGIKTIQNAVPANVTGASAAPSNITAVLSWTNPSDCFDDVMIVGKAGSSISGVPSGDGSAYSANTAFGTGTGFDGGFVLYKGTVSPQTVTGLSLGTTYYFKFFTRKGTNWSTGIEVNMATSAPSSGDYRSAASGNWSSLTTWEISNGSTWGTPTPAQGTPTSASGKITIRNGHNVTVNSSVTVDEVTVDAGGILSVDRTMTIANGACIVNGRIIETGNLSDIITTGVLSFNNGSFYEHAVSGGRIPTATWNAGSTCLISVAGNSPPSGLNQTFNNFTWNCSGQKQPVDLGGFPSNVTGTFSVVNTGTRYISPGGNVTYANYLQTGGIYSILGTGAARIINVTGNFTLQSGQFLMSDANGVTGTMNLAGNFTMTGGSITESATGAGSIVFNGTYNRTTGMQSYSGNVPITSTINFTVNSGAYLQMAAENTLINGLGTFRLLDGGTLGIKSANGITAAGTSSGNIQTTGRVFGTGANYIYNLGSNQFTGSGLPATGITGNVTIAPSSIVTATNPLIINDSLIVDGSFLPGQENQIFSGTGTLAGTGIIKVTRTSAPAAFLTQYSISNRNITNATIDYYASSGGQVVSPITYGNIRFSNTSGINTFGGNVTVNGTLTTTAGGTLVLGQGYLLNASNISNQGILTIDATGKATISTFTNNGILNLNSTALNQYSSLRMDSYSGTGVANAQMFLTGGGGDNAWKWHYVAVPAYYNNKKVFTDIAPYDLMQYDDQYVTDASSSTMDEGFIWHDGYVESTGQLNGPSFSDLVVGRGYAFYNSTDVTVNFMNLSSLQTRTNLVNLQWSGANKANPKKYGYNLLGNSLTCGLDWELVTENSGDIDDAVYYLLNYDFASYVRGLGTGVNGGSKDIPPLQGFMVKANSAGASLNFSGAREHTTQTRYKKNLTLEENSEAATIKPVVKLQLITPNHKDETIVWLSENATNGFDGSCDAYKLSYGGSDYIYTAAGTTNLAINGIPLPDTATTVPIIVTFAGSGTDYKINVTALQGLDVYDVTLIDKYNSGMITDLKKSAEYSFASAEGTFTDRFILKFSKIQTGIDDDVIVKGSAFNIFGSGNNLNTQLLDRTWEGQEGTISIYDLTGRRLFTETNVEWVYRDLKQFNPGLPKGLYIIEIKSEKLRFVSKINLNF